MEASKIRPRFIREVARMTAGGWRTQVVAYLKSVEADLRLEQSDILAHPWARRWCLAYVSSCEFGALGRNSSGSHGDLAANMCFGCLSPPLPRQSSTPRPAIVSWAQCHKAPPWLQCHLSDSATEFCADCQRLGIETFRWHFIDANATLQRRKPHGFTHLCVGRATQWTEILGTALNGYALSRGQEFAHRRLNRLRAAGRVMLPLARFHGCRLASQDPRPATPHAPNTSPIATSRPRAAVATPRAGSPWMINGSMEQAAKLGWDRI